MEEESNMDAILEREEEEGMGSNLASRDVLDRAWQSQSLVRLEKPTDLIYKLACELFWAGTGQFQLR
jgi:hypothetical protein